MIKLIQKYRAKLLKKWFNRGLKARDEKILAYMDRCLDIYESLKYRKHLKYLDSLDRIKEQ